MSPTQLTLKKYRSEGWLCGIVEKFVRFPPPGHRSDLFGFCDIIAIRGDESLYIQACAAASLSARRTKLRNEPNVSIVHLSPHRRVVLIGWAKRGPRGGRKVWTPTIEEII